MTSRLSPAAVPLLPALLLAPLALAPVSDAAAQDGVDLVRFRPSLDAPGLVTTRDSRVGAPWTGGGALLVHYADDPLVVRGAESLEEQDSLVSSLTTVDASAWANLPRVRVGVTLPMPLAASGDAPEADRVVGDLELEVAPELVERSDRGLGLGAFAGLRVPTGDSSAWLGDARASGRLGVVGTADLGRLGLAAHVGGRTGTGAEVDGWTWGPSLEAGAGARVAVVDALTTSLEVTGAHVLGVTTPEGSPFEVVAAAHATPVGALQVSAGAGAGLSRGLGAPDFRIFAGVGWHPPAAAPEPAVTPAPVAAEQAPAATTGELAVRVTDLDGQPIQATVTASPAEGADQILRADDGLARAVVPPGEWSLEVQAEGYRQGSALVRLDAGAVGTATVALAPWTVAVEADRLVLPERIHFAFDSAEIQPASFPLLQEVADLLRARPELGELRVMGHADPQGSRTYNLDLSRRRAEAVRSWLVAAGVAPDRLTAHAFGEEVPLRPGESEAAYAANRRVELLIVQRAAAL